MSEEKRRPDAGETVREGVRSIVGILGALKDAIEQSFDDLRQSGERPDDREQTEADAPKSPADHAKDAVESVRERFDFVTRKELEALREQVERLSARIAALEGDGSDSPESPPDAATGEPEPEAPRATETREPPEERPFRIDSE